MAAAPTDPYVADYVYANDNPVTGIDPSGQSWLDDAQLWLSGIPGAIKSVLKAPGGLPNDVSELGIGISTYQAHSDCNGQLSTAINCGFDVAGLAAGFAGIFELISDPAAVWIGGILYLLTPEEAISK